MNNTRKKQTCFLKAGMEVVFKGQSKWIVKERKNQNGKTRFYLFDEVGNNYISGLFPVKVSYHPFINFEAYCFDYKEVNYFLMVFEDYSVVFTFPNFVKMYAFLLSFLF